MWKKFRKRCLEHREGSLWHNHSSFLDNHQTVIHLVCKALFFPPKPPSGYGWAVSAFSSQHLALFPACAAPSAGNPRTFSTAHLPPDPQGRSRPHRAPAFAAASHFFDSLVTVFLLCPALSSRRQELRFISQTQHSAGQPQQWAPGAGSRWPLCPGCRPTARGTAPGSWSDRITSFAFRASSQIWAGP